MPELYEPGTEASTVDVNAWISATAGVEVLYTGLRVREVQSGSIELFTTSGASVGYYTFENGEPDDYTANDASCVAIVTDTGLIRDLDCSKARFFICEREVDVLADGFYINDVFNQSCSEFCEAGFSTCNQTGRAAIDSSAKFDAMASQYSLNITCDVSASNTDMTAGGFSPFIVPFGMDRTFCVYRGTADESINSCEVKSEIQSLNLICCCGSCPLDLL